MSINSRLEADPSLSEALLPLLLARDFNQKLIECLDDGFVKLVDVMGDDAAIVQAARVSYGAGTKHTSSDRGLIRYLMRNRHTTPLEMVEFKFLVRVPMDCWRQWIRHRTASVNEYSTRYSEAIDSAQRASAWRAQAKSNKQGSEGLVTEWPEGYTIGHPCSDHNGEVGVHFQEGDAKCWQIIRGGTTPQGYLTEQEAELHRLARQVYERRLKMGVAREQARKDLPLSTYTEAYWKIDLHNLFHFLGLRVDSHAQGEIREYGEAILKLITPVVPLAVEAFMDYRVKALTLSGPELKAMEILQMRYTVSEWPLSARENDEFEAKLHRMGLRRLAQEAREMVSKLGVAA